MKAKKTKKKKKHLSGGKTGVLANQRNKPAGSWAGWIVQIYLVLMLTVFPLYEYDGPYYLGKVKWLFFRTASLVMLVLLAMELIGNKREAAGTKRKARTALLSGKERLRKWLAGLSATDRAALLYLTVAVISWFLSEDRVMAWNGVESWYMGLCAQILFIGIYFAVSRFASCKEWELWLMAAANFLVFLVAYLNRFSIDFLGLRKGDFHLVYLGTIGQANLYASYVSAVLPVISGAYMFLWREKTEKNRLRRTLAAAVILIGFGSSFVQNSDCLYVGLGLGFLFLFWFALEEGEAWSRYVELCLLAVSAAKLTGILQNAFPERVPTLDALSFAVTKGKGGWLVLAALLFVYAVTCQARRKMKEKTRVSFTGWVRLFRKLFYAASALAMVCLPLLIYLATAGKIPVGEGVWQRTGYLVFSNSWGSGRGSNWILCIGMFAAYPLFRKLFGCGPDMLQYHMDKYHGEAYQAIWGEVKVMNAHNEWLNAAMNYGLAGAAAYLSVFFGALTRILKNRDRRPALLAAGVAIVSYMGNNLFCSQNVVGTSVIFIIIGGAERLIRMDEFPVRP